MPNNNILALPSYVNIEYIDPNQDDQISDSFDLGVNEILSTIEISSNNVDVYEGEVISLVPNNLFYLNTNVRNVEELIYGDSNFAFQPQRFSENNTPQQFIENFIFLLASINAGVWGLASVLDSQTQIQDQSAKDTQTARDDLKKERDRARETSDRQGQLDTGTDDSAFLGDGFWSSLGALLGLGSGAAGVSGIRRFLGKNSGLLKNAARGLVLAYDAYQGFQNAEDILNPEDNAFYRGFYDEEGNISTAGRVVGGGFGLIAGDADGGIYNAITNALKWAVVGSRAGVYGAITGLILGGVAGLVGSEGLATGLADLSNLNAFTEDKNDVTQEYLRFSGLAQQLNVPENFNILGGADNLSPEQQSAFYTFLSGGATAAANLVNVIPNSITGNRVSFADPNSREQALYSYFVRRNINLQHLFEPEAFQDLEFAESIRNYQASIQPKLKTNSYDIANPDVLLEDLDAIGNFIGIHLQPEFYKYLRPGYQQEFLPQDIFNQINDLSSTDDGFDAQPITELSFNADDPNQMPFEFYPDEDVVDATSQLAQSRYSSGTQIQSNYVDNSQITVADGSGGGASQNINLSVDGKIDNFAYTQRLGYS